MRCSSTYVLNRAAFSALFYNTACGLSSHTPAMCIFCLEGAKIYCSIHPCFPPGGTAVAADKWQPFHAAERTTVTCMNAVCRGRPFPTRFPVNDRQALTAGADIGAGSCWQNAHSKSEEPFAWLFRPCLPGRHVVVEPRRGGWYLTLQ